MHQVNLVKLNVVLHRDSDNDITLSHYHDLSMLCQKMSNRSKHDSIEVEEIVKG